MIKFNEELHKYTDETGAVYTSATQFISKFHKHFEDVADFWLLYKALQYSSKINKKEKIKKYDEQLDLDINLSLFDSEDYRDISTYALRYCDKDLIKFRNKFNVRQLVMLDIACGKIKQHWALVNKKSTTKGTAFHNWKEQVQFDEGTYKINDVCYKVIQRENSNLMNLEIGVHPEVRMWNRHFKLAGTADQVVVLPGKKVIVRDWKGFPLDTPIATRTGWSTIGELEIGSEIFDGNGHLTKVEHLSEIHHNPCYKIKFDTNDTLVADHEHRWEVSYREKSTGKLVDSIMTTEEMSLFKGNALLIKVSGIALPEKELPLDPYMLGLWLADGNRTCGTITCVNPEIWSELRNRGFEFSENHNRNNAKAESRTILGIRGVLVSLGLIGNKHIPEMYIRSSFNQRLELLRGFMDGDGHLNRKRKRNVMETTKLWQAEAIMELTASLGIKSTLIKAFTSGFGKTKIPTFHVCFSTILNPFLVRNKDYDKVVCGKRFFKSNYRYITSIEKVPTVPTKCLGVKSPLHTYLVGKSYIKTHNTNNELKFDNKYDNMLDPISHLPDCNMTHYKLQLSIYGWMLEQFGYEVIGLEIEHFQLEEEGDSWRILKHDYHPLEYAKEDVIKMLRYGI